MSKIDYLPLGSVVLLQNGTQKVIIVARGMNVPRAGSTYFFDYGAVVWPQGVSGDLMYYFNHDAVAKVCFYGCVGEEEEVITESLNRYVEEHPDLKRITGEEWNKLPE